MLFSFKAIGKDGQVYKGTAEAEDRYALARRLRRDGETLVSAEKATKAGENIFEVIVSQFGTVPVREKILFSRNMSAMIGAGLSVSRSLSVMERQTKNPKFKSILAELGNSVRKGTSLSAALGGFPKVFSSIVISMVKAGEESGKVSDSLKNAAEQMEYTYKLKRRVRGALVYPSIIVTAMVIVGVILFIFVVPTLTDTFKQLDIDLPLSTRIIVATSDFVSGNLVVSLVTIVALAVFTVLGIRTKKGKRLVDFTLLHLPVIKVLVVEVNSARTAHTISSLLTSGVEIVSALSITKDVLQNSYYKEILSKAEEKVQKGTSISDVFAENENLYPVLVAEMMSVGEEVGDLPQMLSRVADFYDDEVEQKTKNLSTIIEPVLMAVVGAIVGFFAIAMISPMYSLVGGL